MTTGYTDQFGGSTINPAQVAYASLSLSANLSTYWPAFATGTQQPLARIMDIVTTVAGVVIRLPDAVIATLGQDVFFNNKGANSYQIADIGGNVIATIAPGALRYVYLIDNTTNNGLWTSVLFGTTASSPDASQLAGYGIKAIGSTLNQSSQASTISTNQSFGEADRAKLFVNVGGAINNTLPLTATVGNDYFLEIRNQGTGTVTLTPSGGELIDGSASITLQLNESCFVNAGTGAWYTVGRGRNTQFNFTQLLKTVTGGTATLTLTEASNVVQTYSGTLLSNEVLVLPAVVQVYYIANKCTGAFTFTIQSPTPGSTLVLSNNQNAVIFCDGVNVINASTSIAGITSLLLAAGSAGSPSLAFSAANNGIFAPSSSAIAVSAGGTEVTRWSSGQNLTGAGTVGAPSWSFTASPGTGIYRPAADQVGIATNATLRMLFDATGGVTPGAAVTQDFGALATAWATTYSNVFRSVVATGTAPLIVASTTKVTNLNADLLDGADWASPIAIGTGTPANGTFADLTGRLKGFTEFVTTLTGVTGATNLDLNLGNIFDLTLTGNTTVTFTNPPASGTLKSATLIIRQGGAGSYTLTVTNGKYTDGIVPVLSTGVGQIDMLNYFTLNAGAAWFGMYAMANIS
jgi:hypothetical protein